MSAWKDTCASANPSTLVIPGGTYLLGPVKFQGPCQAAVAVQAQGTLKAPSDVNKFKAAEGWFDFQNIDGLTLSGGGIFDGQGQSAWAQNDCAKTGKCGSLPIVSCPLSVCLVNYNVLDYAFRSNKNVKGGREKQ